MLLQGMLAIGAALLGSPCVIGLDLDPDALQVAQDNCEQFEDPLPVSDLLCACCCSSSSRQFSVWGLCQHLLQQ
jgi:predicted RNA methylase